MHGHRKLLQPGHDKDARWGEFAAGGEEQVQSRESEPSPNRQGMRQAYRIVGLADETKTGQGRSDGEDLQTLREQPQPWWARHAEVPQKM